VLPAWAVKAFSAACNVILDPQDAVVGWSDMLNVVDKIFILAFAVFLWGMGYWAGFERASQMYKPRIQVYEKQDQNNKSQK
jgi:hypothetical protein